MIYVYAVTRQAVIPDSEAVDQSRRFGVTTFGRVSAVFTPVKEEEFTQEVIDRRSGDLEWLGAIGYRHQGVISALMSSTAVVPLRAFTLFSGEEALRGYLQENEDTLSRVLERLDGKREWTLRIGFEPERWSRSLVQRVAALRELQQQIDVAAAGKAFLLRRKLDDERKRASAEAESQVVAEIEKTVRERLRGETLAESRQRRDGAFPQINVLVDRDEEASLQALHADLVSLYGAEGVNLALTGPWPPYSFAHA